jgi:glycosyltransferase involved in cell wall biosynthesis
MRILFPLLNLNNSGGLRIALQYCKGLSTIHDNVFLLIPNYNKGSNYDDYIDDINILSIKSSYLFKDKFYYLGTVLGFFNKINGDDLIIATSWQSLIIVLLNKLSFKNIILIIQHDDDIILGKKFSLSNIVKKALFRIIYSLPIRKICVSDWLSSYLKNKYNIKVDSISNGVASDSFYGLMPDVWTPPIDTVDLLCLARSVDWKGFDDYLIACEILYSKIPNLRLIIVSQEKLTFTTKVPFVILKPSNDKELGLIYRTSSVFVFPSWIEGFGLPPLEAMANGLPVVTTLCGGISDFAQNEFNCITVDIQSPDQIANAVLKLLNDNNLMRNFSKNGLLTAKKFKMENSIYKLNSLILNN